MATQEERLTAVEQFTEQAAAHIRDTEENTTILLGVIRKARISSAFLNAWA